MDRGDLLARGNEKCRTPSDGSKNPTSHRAVSYDDPVIASDITLLAELLLRLLHLHQIDRRLNDEPA